MTVQQTIVRTADLIEKGLLTEENIDNLSKEEIGDVMLQLGITPDESGLFLIIALFGSTHSKANWREVFEHEYDLPVFDPKETGKGWKRWYSKIEALFMEIAKVIVLGLHNGVSENDAVLEGSMGSLLESTMTLLLAYIRGQKVILYEEPNFIDSMDSPSSIILYLIKEFAWEEMRQLDPEDVYLVHSKEEAAQKAAEVAQEKVNPQIAQTQKTRDGGRVVIVGSGWSNVNDNQIAENLYGEDVVDMRRDDKRQWEIAYQLAENYLTAAPERKLELQEQLRSLIRTLEATLVSEWKPAGKVVCSISSDRLSKGAMTEIPMIIALCISQRIPIDINIELLNPLQCLRNILPEQEINDIKEAQSIFSSRETLNQNDLATIKSILDRAGFKLSKSNPSYAMQILHLLTKPSPNREDWDEFVALLNESGEIPPLMRDIDNAERARIILVGHITRLVRDERISSIVRFSEGSGRKAV